MSPTNSSTSAQAIRVVLDCDTKNEIDDQMAIAYALGCNAIDVVGVVSVQNTVASGPDSLAIYHEEAERIVALSGVMDVPCRRGANRPMEHIDDVVASEGLDFLIAAGEQGPLTLLATGPATDVAAFVQVAPQAVQENVHIVWAGAFPDADTWNAHKFGELNARADIAAWRRVYRSAVNLTVLPGWPAVEKVRMPWQACVANFRDLHTPLGEYLADLVTEYVASRRAMDMDVERSSYKVLWDIVNVALISIPDAVPLTSLALPDVDPAGVPSWDAASGRRAPFAMDVDAPAILADFWSALRDLSRRSDEPTRSDS